MVVCYSRRLFNAACNSSRNTITRAQRHLRYSSCIGGLASESVVPRKRLFSSGQDFKPNAKGGTEERLVTIAESRLEELLQAEIAHLASVSVRALTLREVLDQSEPRQLAQFIQSDVPIRHAVRIRMIESLSCWRRVPELVQTHDQLTAWYRSIRLKANPDDLKGFTSKIKKIRLEGRDLVTRTAAGLHMVKQIAGDEYDDDFLNRWMDGFFLSRIGTSMLLDQYRTCAAKEYGGRGVPTGIINPHCDATEVCLKVVATVTELCKEVTGQAPPCIVESYAVGEGDPCPRKHAPAVFSYVPGYLRYIMMEILKNSFHWTVKNAADAEDVKNRPVHVLVSADEQRIIIRVSDRAGGIPFDVGERVWSYFYGAAANKWSASATPLAGYGVGLPLSRLHARYLGGQLEIRSFPGYGTDAFLLLPRLEADQVEEIPRSSTFSKKDKPADPLPRRPSIQGAEKLI